MMLKRPTNPPRADILKHAAITIASNGGPLLARVFFKFDCEACGSREVIPDPNVLPDSGVCTVCGHVTTILGAGYALQVRRDTSIDWDHPEQHTTLFARPHYMSDKGQA